jgi:hypothetical protein
VGWNYRRSTRLGPFGVSLSKRGVGYSVGARGFRVGVRSDGRRYTRVGIPGSGLSYTAFTAERRPYNSTTGCLILIAVIPFCAATVAELIHRLL